MTEDNVEDLEITYDEDTLQPTEYVSWTTNNGLFAITAKEAERRKNDALRQIFQSKPKNQELLQQIQELKSELAEFKEQWKKDCDLLMTVIIYGNPPGGWTDPDRREQFQRAVVDVERRLREA
jgi:DNA repair exonuclease SbcCD ATPase subunit